MAKMNLYTSFAKKLKMNRNFNFSKKGKNNDEEGSKNKSNSNKKVKSIQLSKEKLKKIIHSSTQSKNHLEKKIKTVNNTFKKSFSKSKENSSSHHNNNNNSNKTTKKNIQSQIIANSLNNILSCYKNKRNFKLSPKQNYPNFKKKRYKNPNVSKNKNRNKQGKVDKFIKKICKENSSSSLKKKLTISTEGKGKNHNKTQEIKTKGNLIFNKKFPDFHSKILQEMIDSITSGSYNNKSRNKNNLGINLTGTKTNLPTDRDKNKKGPYYINNKKIMLQTQTIYFQNKKKIRTSQIFNEKDKEKNSKEKKKKNSNNNSLKKNNNNSKNNLSGSNKFKTYLDIKFNLYQKTRNNVINELKKSIGINTFTMSQLNSNQIHKKNYSSSKSKNNEKMIKNKKSSKILNDKISININIHNDNKIYYNKIYNIKKKSDKSSTNSKQKDLSNNKSEKKQEK